MPRGTPATHIFVRSELNENEQMTIGIYTNECYECLVARLTFRVGRVQVAFPQPFTSRATWKIYHKALLYSEKFLGDSAVVAVRFHDEWAKMPLHASCARKV